MKLDILAIGVHPDDIELCCVGTLLRHQNKGFAIGMLDLTRGELGTRGNAEIRLREASEAAAQIGVSIRDNAGLKDGFFEHNQDSIQTICSFIRKYRPEVVLTNALKDRHPDHGRAAGLVADSCFFSGLRKVITSMDGKKQDPWRPRAVYHYIQDHYLEPDFVVDISQFMEKKMELIMTFRSQFFDPNSVEPSSPISGKDFLEYIRAQARVRGRSIGVEYAEGFNTRRSPGVDNILDLL